MVAMEIYLGYLNVRVHCTLNFSDQWSPEPMLSPI